MPSETLQDCQRGRRNAYSIDPGRKECLRVDRRHSSKGTWSQGKVRSGASPPNCLQVASHTSRTRVRVFFAVFFRPEPRQEKTAKFCPRSMLLEGSSFFALFRPEPRREKTAKFCPQTMLLEGSIFCCLLGPNQDKKRQQTFVLELLFEGSSFCCLFSARTKTRKDNKFLSSNSVARGFEFLLSFFGPIFSARTKTRKDSKLLSSNFVAFVTCNS